MRTAGVVLAGGRSVRMGQDKASLLWRGGTLLGQAFHALAEARCGPLVVVRAAGQQLPTLPAGVVVVTDPEPGIGPAGALVTGLAAVAAQPDGPPTAFVVSTDLPLLSATSVRRLLGELATRPDVDVLGVLADGHPQWLAAAYRVGARHQLAASVAAGERRVQAVVARCRTSVLSPAALGIDPGEFTNVNDPETYARVHHPRRD